MHDTIPTNITNGIRISVVELPKIFKKNENETKECQDNSSIKKEKIKKPNLVQTMLIMGLAELVGTALLLFLGCMGCVHTDIMPLPHHVSAISFGFTVMLIIQTFGHISGAHLNPQVTLATVILGYLKPVFAPVYIIAQFIGSLVGFGMLKILLPPEYTTNEFFNTTTNQTQHMIGLCSSVVHPNVSMMQALALETITTAILILVCCSVWDKRNAHNSDSVSLRFGLIISTIAMAAGPYTGASMNTARTFGPALFNNDWGHHWIYWVGPTLGAFVGSLFYKTIFEAPKEEPKTLSEILENVPLNEKCEKSNNV